MRWLEDKRLTLVCQIALATLCYLITHNATLLCSILAVFILFEFAFASHCNDRCHHSPTSYMKYSKCYTSPTPTRLNQPLTKQQQLASKQLHDMSAKPTTPISHDDVIKELERK